jgi:hypothetical protein
MILPVYSIISAIMSYMILDAVCKSNQIHGKPKAWELVIGFIFCLISWPYWLLIGIIKNAKH